MALVTCVTANNWFPFYHISQLAYSEDFDFSYLVFTRLSDAEDDRAEGALAIKLIIGFDFAVTLSSPDSSCVLFDINSEQSVELKWLIFKQTQKMIPFVTCEISLG